MSDTKKVTVTVPKDVWSKAKSAAALANMPVSEWVSMVVQKAAQ